MCEGDSADPWDSYAARWDDTATRAYAAAAYDSLVDATTRRGLSLAGATVCDFGCGTGLLTERLADVVGWVDAVDTSAAMLEQLTAKIERRGLTNVRATTTLPRSHGTFDLVVCSSVLGFVDDYAATVHQLGELLGPGGLFVQWDWERRDDDPEPHGLGRDEIRIALTAAGLDRVEVDTALEVVVDGMAMRPLMGVGQKA